MQALRRAPASTVSPIGYFELVTAVLFGFVVFGDLPDAATWAGAALIVGSGAWIAFRGQGSAPTRARCSKLSAGGPCDSGAILIPALPGFIFLEGVMSGYAFG